MNRLWLTGIVALLLACLAALPVEAPGAVRLPALFSDHMVVQRERPIHVWGSADPGEQVAVSLAGHSQTTKADASGNWSVMLAPLAAGSGHTLVVSGSNTLTVQDVLVGDVWLCSGQSNMGVPVRDATDGVQETAAADYPQIRFFTVGQQGSLEPQTKAAGHWDVCSPKTAAGATAVGYFFGRELHRQLHVPIGLINSSVGGSIIEGWVSRQALDTLPELRATTAARVDHMRAQPDDIRRFPAERRQWETRYRVRPPANEGVSRGWADPDFDDRDWKQAAFPTRWSQAAGVDRGGVFWLRKEVTFPASLAGNPFVLVFNFMHEQYDTAYFNGVEIGHSGDQPPLFVMSQRRYVVPGRLVKAGKNVIALRVVAPSERLDLLGRGAHGDYGLPLNRKQVGNVWRVKVESLFPPMTAQAFASRPRANDAALQNTPVVLFGGMIHPLLPLPIRGVIWYQGESNTGRPAEYRKLFPLLIEDWRRGWKQPDLPFYCVQLANFLPPPSDPNEKSGWAELREAQAMTVDHVPHTGMAVAIDVGEADNIHPIDKQSVGRRLALAALHQTYGRDVPYSGPRYESMHVEGDRIRLRFRHAEGLMATGGAPKRFAIAGENRKFAWADARIDGDSVIVSSPEVSHPVAVRYAWADNPQGANLYNAAGLPASPFRTDDW